MNLGASGGAGIKEHLHLHVVPRWVGDTNFMPVLAETKSMPQHLEASYDQLFPIFAQLNAPPKQEKP
jgi:ATP adenylyltransferase